MVELALGLCVLVFVLFICLMAAHFSEGSRMKMLIGLTMSLMSALAMGLFAMYKELTEPRPGQGTGAVVFSAGSVYILHCLRNNSGCELC